VAEHEWKITKLGEMCGACGTQFGLGQAYYSVLLQQAENFTRQDYCAACFPSKRLPDAFYFWKSMRPEQDEGADKKDRRPLVDVQYVFDFFTRLDGDENPQRMAFRYILALMLARKKVLVYDGRTTDGGGKEILTYRERKGGQAHRVIEPALTAEEIAALSEELGRLLGLSPAAPASPASPAPQTAQG
jgi:hypothetical protein